jgi:predicted transglutaminase-like cysteine proteinase
MPSPAAHLLCALLLAASASACALREGGAPLVMLEGETVAPPSGWTDFCVRAPDHCAAPAADGEELPAGPDAFAQLEEINRFVNEAIEPEPDARRFGVLDRWSLPLTVDKTDLGDCEDYALEKRRQLIEAGWPPSALRLAVGASRETGVHAALIALTEEGDFVLDNLVDEVRPWTQTDYIWLKRQASADPTEWRRVGYQ